MGPVVFQRLPPAPMLLVPFWAGAQPSGTPVRAGGRLPVFPRVARTNDSLALQDVISTRTLRSHAPVRSGRGNGALLGPEDACTSVGTTALPAEDPGKCHFQGAGREPPV